MKTTILFCSALLAAPLLFAQDDKGAAAAMPNPKTEGHAPLAALAGDWTTVCKTQAIAGMPGFEEATETTGTEHAELICGDLWLKASTTGVCAGKPVEGLWLLGYDPTQKKYRCIWVSSMEEPLCEADGAYDAAKKEWTFRGNTPMGAFKSVYTFADADHSTEVCYLTKDGKETECMRIERTRSKGAARPSDATAKKDSWPSEQHTLLAAGIGDWNVTTTCTVPGQGPLEEKGSEKVASICDGRWFWSDFQGVMMGVPYEGHSLLGYDPTTKQYVSYWFDSMSATHAWTRGTYDPAKKEWTLKGECLDPSGKTAKIEQTYAQKDADTRHLQMSFTGPDGKQEMNIHYVRAGG